MEVERYNWGERRKFIKDGGKVSGLGDYVRNRKYRVLGRIGLGVEGKEEEAVGRKFECFLGGLGEG